MKNVLYLLFAALISCSLGCSMCCGPYDYDYPTFGGKHQRAVSNWTRVGSILSDPLATADGLSADSNLEAPPERRESTRDFDTDETDDELDRIQREIDREFNEDPERLESISPMDGREPGPSEDDDSTASRQPHNRLRTGNWR